MARALPAGGPHTRRLRRGAGSPPSRAVALRRQVAAGAPIASGTRGLCLQQMMANHLVKPDSRNCKRSRELEPQVSDSPQAPSLGKSESSLPECSGLFYKEEALEKDLSGDV